MLMRPYAGWSSSRREMERLRREMNRLFSDWPARAQAPIARGYPAMNVWTDEESAIVTAELPGMDREKIEISVEDDTLTVRGQRQLYEKEGVTYHRRERRYGTFVRSFRLPFRVDADNVEATFTSGVLKIVLPRAEEEKPKRISIQAG